MEVKFLADCTSYIPAISVLQQLEMNEGIYCNYAKAYEKFQGRSESRGEKLPLTLVAFENTLPVGSVSLVENDLQSHQHLTPWIATLFVISKYRKRGVASFLMQKAEEIAIDLGYESLYLFTPSAAGYYHKIGGWDDLGMVQTGQDFPESTLMQKKIGQGKRADG